MVYNVVLSKKKVYPSMFLPGISHCLQRFFKDCLPKQSTAWGVRNWRMLGCVLGVLGASVWLSGCLSGCTGPTGSLSEEPVVDGNTPPSQRTASTTRPLPTIGRTCRQDQDCSSDLFCELQVPEGYCTKACQFSIDCPGTSLCVRITFAQGQFQRCMQTCSSTEDCRPRFVCYRPGIRSSQICFPILP